jgi:hypothetical protein
MISTRYSHESVGTGRTVLAYCALGKKNSAEYNECF